MIRMKYHHYQLPEKIVDLLEIGYPDLIVTDAVEIAMGGNQMREHSLNLGAIIISKHPLSHDVVCAHIPNLKPTRYPSFVKLKKEDTEPLRSMGLKLIQTFPYPFLFWNNFIGFIKNLITFKKLREGVR